jgi:NADH:ubiquinone oxidoreductase subunit 6 (subunit J)
MGMDVAFWILAVISVGAALAVVFMRDIFRVALFMILCFFAVAGIYVALSADFLAAAQVLIYVGAIGVLLMFAIMLTREGKRGSLSGRLRPLAMLVALLFMVTMILVVISTDWNVAAEVSKEPTTEKIAQSIFSRDGFVLAFEIAAALLLAAAIGAIVLVREKDK